MIIRIGTFTKEINSTKRPNLSREIEIQLKQGCSILTPVIEIRDEIYNPSWNYIYIPKWDRYYFLHDAVIQNGIWFVACAIDVLASWRTTILNSTAYVRRSASDYTNHIEDPTWSHTDEPVIASTSINCGMNSTGTFILFTASDASGDKLAVPSLSAYVMGAGTLSKICNYMFSSDFFDMAVEEIEDPTSQAMCKTFFNPFQYVIKCMWVPFTPPVDRSSTINFGWWESSESASILGSHIWTHTFTFTVGSHNDWTDRNPAWANYTLYVPGFGQQTISPDFAGLTLTAEIICDLTTGQAGLFIKHGGGIVQSATGQLGADIQLSSLYEDIINDLGSKSGAVNTAIRATAGAMSGIVANKTGRDVIKNVALASTPIGWMAGASGTVEFGNIDLSGSSTIVDQIVSGAQSALQPTLSTIGANGTRAITETEVQAVFTSTKYARYTDIHDRLGGVCHKIRQLNGLSGYTEVVNPHVDAPATSSEIEMINNFLSGGFYIE